MLVKKERNRDHKHLAKNRWLLSCCWGTKSYYLCGLKQPTIVKSQFYMSEICCGMIVSAQASTGLHRLLWAWNLGVTWAAFSWDLGILIQVLPAVAEFSFLLQSPLPCWPPMGAALRSQVPLILLFQGPHHLQRQQWRLPPLQILFIIQNSPGKTQWHLRTHLMMSPAE